MFRSVTRALATSEFCDYHTTLTHLQPKDSWSTSRQLVIMGTQKLSPQGQRLRVIILTVPIMAATSGSQLSRVASQAYSQRRTSIFQWSCTNDSCLENPNANFLVPETGTQTERSSNLVARRNRVSSSSNDLGGAKAQRHTTIYKSIFLRYHSSVRLSSGGKPPLF